jgi:hypothetical protein
MSTKRTSTQLIEGIKRRASVPESQSTFDTEDFLEFANEELALALVPQILTLHEDFLLYEEPIALETNESEYEIPYRAIGNKLRDVQFLHDDQGHKSEMTRIGIGESFSEYDVRTETNLKKYYIKNNSVVLNPPVGSNPSGSLLMIYYIKPSQLVSEDRVAIITGINRTSGEITVNEIPEVFTSTEQYDFYKVNSPHTILNKDISLTGLNPATNTVTFNPDDIPAKLKVGDHLSLAEECMIPQIPSDLTPMLEQLVACRILESMGDTQGLQNALIKLAQMEKAAGIIIDNRVDDAPQKIVARHGLVRTSIFSKRFNRR